MPKFNIGKLYMTRGIDYEIKEDEKYTKELLKCFRRYLSCDWGELTEEDRKINEEAIKNSDRILGAYNTSKGKIYIITEANHKYTTILKADEY